MDPFAADLKSFSIVIKLELVSGKHLPCARRAPAVQHVHRDVFPQRFNSSRGGKTCLLSWLS